MWSWFCGTLVALLFPPPTHPVPWVEECPQKTHEPENVTLCRYRVFADIIKLR